VSTTLVAEPQAGFDIPVQLHLLDKSKRVVAARLRQASHAWFELSCAERIEQGQRLTLSHERGRLEVEVTFAAQQSTDRYTLAVKVIEDEPSEIRCELRLPMNLPATLRVAGESTQLQARIVDMSPSGMGIEVATMVPSGAKVCINLEQGLAFGEIRFCRQKSPGVFLTGFALQEYIGQETP
jgi:hypothetical protein